MHELRQKGVALKATEQPIDTSNAAGKAFLDMLGVFAEFETNLRRERASGIGPAAIAKQLKMAAGRQQAGAAVGGLGGRGSISASIAWPMRSGASPIGSSP